MGKPETLTPEKLDVLAEEAKVELALDKPTRYFPGKSPELAFGGDISLAAEFVYYRAVRKGRLPPGDSEHAKKRIREIVRLAGGISQRRLRELVRLVKGKRKR